MSADPPRSRPGLFLVLVLVVLGGIGWSIQAEVWTPREERLERLRVDRAAASADMSIQERRYRETLKAPG